MFWGNEALIPSLGIKYINRSIYYWLDCLILDHIAKVLCFALQAPGKHIAVTNNVMKGFATELFSSYDIHVLNSLALTL